MNLSPENSEFALSDLGQIALRVQDLEASTTYYRDRLGMSFLFQAPPALAFFQCGSVRLMLSAERNPEEAPPPPSSTVLYFRVSNIEETHRVLDRRGVTFLSSPQCIHRTEEGELWMAFFKDPDQHPLAIMAEKKA